MKSIPVWLILVLVFQVKHFLSDYPLQRRWMLGKFKPGWEFIGPLSAHCLVHALMTYTIILFATSSPPTALGCSMFDFVIHFTMDRIKASPRMLGRYKGLDATTAPKATPAQWRSNDRFWWALGFDQMIHHLTHYAMIWWVLR